MNLLHREWDEPFTLPTAEGPLQLNLHRIDLELDVHTGGFLWDYTPPGENRKKRRVTIPQWSATELADMGTEQEALCNIFGSAREDGFDSGLIPGAHCIYGLHITVKMPPRHSDVPVPMHCIALLPLPLAWADLKMFSVPASLVCQGAKP